MKICDEPGTLRVFRRVCNDALLCQARAALPVSEAVEHSEPFALTDGTPFSMAQ